MSILITKKAAPATPAVNKSMVYVDTADNKIKQIDPNGVINVLPQDGLRDRNIITNGGFMIQQRQVPGSTAIGGISTTTRAGQVADRWAVTTSTASNLAWAQIDTAAAPETGLNSRYYGSIIKSSAAKKVLLSQFIIASRMAHLRGNKVRVSIKINIKVGNAQTLKLGLLQLNASGTVDTCPAFLSGAFSAVTGTDPAWGTNLAAITPDASPTGENGTIVGSYLEIAAQQTTWVRSSCVFTVPSNCRNLVMVVYSNDVGGSTDNISFAEAQITQGVEIVDYVEPPMADTLMECQRFFSKSFPYAIAPAASVSIANGGYGSSGPMLIAGSGTALGTQIQIVFPVRMWKVPTITYYTPTTTGALIFRHTGTTPAAQGSTATVANTLTDIGCTVASTNEATANTAVGNWCSIHWAAEAEFIT